MVASESKSSIEGVVFLSPEEAREAFDRTARHVAGINGEEFLRRWDADEYQELHHSDPILFGRLRRVAEARAFAGE